MRPVTFYNASSAGDVSSLVAHLLKNEKVSPKELSEIRKVIDKRDTK